MEEKLITCPDCGHTGSIVENHRLYSSEENDDYIPDWECVEYGSEFDDSDLDYE